MGRLLVRPEDPEPGLRPLMSDEADTDAAAGATYRMYGDSSSAAETRERDRDLESIL
jgi:hypothetical protein